MHELIVTKSIQQIVLKHAKKRNVKKVLTVNLEIGALSDLQDEWIQRYFDRLSRGTVSEGAKLKINRMPASFQCNQCHHLFEIYSLLEDDLTCQKCHSRELSLVSGKEYHVKSMEAQ
jgi:hydrogenase nickel incorporation protein HypA/HybF